MGDGPSFAKLSAREDIQMNDFARHRNVPAYWSRIEAMGKAAQRTN